MTDLRSPCRWSAAIFRCSSRRALRSVVVASVSEYFVYALAYVFASRTANARLGSSTDSVRMSDFAASRRSTSWRVARGRAARYPLDRALCDLGEPCDPGLGRGDTDRVGRESEVCRSGGGRRRARTAGSAGRRPMPGRSSSAAARGRSRRRRPPAQSRSPSASVAAGCRRSRQGSALLTLETSFVFYNVRFLSDAPGFPCYRGHDLRVRCVQDTGRNRRSTMPKTSIGRNDR